MYLWILDLTWLFQSKEVRLFYQPQPFSNPNTHDIRAPHHKKQTKPSIDDTNLIHISDTSNASLVVLQNTLVDDLTCILMMVLLLGTSVLLGVGNCIDYVLLNNCSQSLFAVSFASGYCTQREGGNHKGKITGNQAKGAVTKGKDHGETGNSASPRG